MRRFFTYLLLLSAPSVYAQTPLDWSVVFKSFEKGCQFDARLNRLLESFFDVDYDAAAYADPVARKLRLNHPNRINLPAVYRSQTQPPMTLHRAEFHENGERFILDQTRLKLSGTYYGLPVIHLSKTFQLETAGYEYVRLLLDASPEQARKVLQGKYRPLRQYNPALEGHETLQATLRAVDIGGQKKTAIECRFVHG